MRRLRSVPIKMRVVRITNLVYRIDWILNRIILTLLQLLVRVKRHIYGGLLKNRKRLNRVNAV